MNLNISISSIFWVFINTPYTVDTSWLALQKQFYIPSSFLLLGFDYGAPGGAKKVNFQKSTTLSATPSRTEHPSATKFSDVLDM